MNEIAGMPLGEQISGRHMHCDYRLTLSYTTPAEVASRIEVFMAETSRLACTRLNCSRDELLSEPLRMPYADSDGTIPIRYMRYHYEGCELVALLRII